MKLFETPYVEVIKFAVQDVITVSGDEDEDLDLGGMIGANCAGG